MRTMIYEDPVTQEKPDEEVELLHLINTYAGHECWLVQYDDGFQAERFIDIKQMAEVRGKSAAASGR